MKEERHLPRHWNQTASSEGKEVARRKSTSPQHRPPLVEMAKPYHHPSLPTICCLFTRYPRLGLLAYLYRCSRGSVVDCNLLRREVHVGS